MEEKMEAEVVGIKADEVETELMNADTLKREEGEDKMGEDINWELISDKIDRKMKKSGLQRYVEEFDYSGDIDIDQRSARTGQPVSFSAGIYGKLKGGVNFVGRVFVDNYGKTVGVLMQNEETDDDFDLDDKNALDLVKKWTDRKKNQQKYQTGSFSATFIDPFKPIRKRRR